MSLVERIPERRIAPRAEAACRVFVTEPLVACAELPCEEELLVPLFGRAVNISETGVLVEVEEPLCFGRRVMTTIELEGGPRLVLRGRVARTTRVRGSPLFRLGIEFDPLPADQREALRDVIREGIISTYLN
jgi:hypothetical protein